MKLLWSIMFALVLGIAAASTCGLLTHAQPQAGLPSVIHWHGADWSVIPVEAEFDDSLLGETFCRDRLVFVDIAQEPDEVRDTFLHETMHVISNCAVNKTDVHSAIYYFSPHLVEFLHFNPDAARYLSGH